MSTVLRPPSLVPWMNRISEFRGKAAIAGTLDGSDIVFLSIIGYDFNFHNMSMKYWIDFDENFRKKEKRKGEVKKVKKVISTPSACRVK
jgi:hypothetical protein